MSFFRFIEGLSDRLFVVAGAFLGSQIPAFMHQYTRNLQGHIEELNHLIDNLIHFAQSGGKTFEQYIQKFLNSSDPDFIMQGEFMQMIEMRLHNLNEALVHLKESSIWSRPYVFIKEMNYDIAKSTVSSFQPSLSLTIEGLCYTCMGVLIGYLGCRLLTKSLRILYSRRPKPRPGTL